MGAATPAAPTATTPAIAYPAPLHMSFVAARGAGSDELSHEHGWEGRSRDAVRCCSSHGRAATCCGLTPSLDIARHQPA
jgi:hypothetical protein